MGIPLKFRRKQGNRWLVGLGLVLLALAITVQVQLSASAIADPLKFVNVRSINPNILLDIRYATKNNFTNQQLYRQAKCFLRASVAEKLSRVQIELETRGLGLKVYDCYRPLSVQKRMWQIKPDPNYVANPANGSRHNRGSAVDLTLVDRKGKMIEMPTDFDVFSDRAHQDYDDLSKQVKEHRQILRDVMVENGFVALRTEWWHFDAEDWQKFPVANVSFEAIR